MCTWKVVFCRSQKYVLETT